MMHRNVNPYLAVLVITILASGAACSLMQQIDRMGSEDVPLVTVRRHVSGSTIDTLDTSDWKTYRNEEYGFEFQYPQQWILCDLIAEPNCASQAPNYVLGVRFGPYGLGAPPAPDYCQVTEDKPRCEKYDIGRTVAWIDWEFKYMAMRSTEKRIAISLEIKDTDELHKKQFRQLLSTFQFTK